MRSGGGGQYDMVSASGDASLRLIYGGDVAETNVSLVPAWKDFQSALKSPASNTVKGKHYGISLQFGPNILMYNTKKEPKPTSWSAIYDPKNKGKISVPDNPIQIADAALYLSKTQPSLGIKDPDELDQKQLDAAVALLKKQKPLLKKYWVWPPTRSTLFKNGGSTLGALVAVSALDPEGGGRCLWPPSTPKEGVTGWLDTWMMSAKAKHPNCAYMRGLHLLAQGAGAAGDVLRRDAREQEGLPVHGQDLARARARSTRRTHLTRTTARSSSGRHRSPIAATAGEGLHVVHEMGSGLDAGQELANRRPQDHVPDR